MALCAKQKLLNLEKFGKNIMQTPQQQPQEHVIAGVWVRLLAVLYDGMLLLAMLFLVSVVLVSVGTVLFGEVGSQANQAQKLPTWYQNWILSPSFVLTLVGFYGIFWRKTGQTLGMQTWRLQVVTSSGTLLTWRQSAIRIVCACIVPAVCALLGGLIHKSYNGMAFSGIFGFLLNYLFCLVHPKGLAVHDWLSNTVTVRIPRRNHQGIFAKK